MRALLVVVARSAALSLGVLSASAVAAWVDAEPPANYPLTWGGEPEVVLSSTRSEIVLNGLWRFLPASGPAAQAPTETGWGYIPVPGSWRDRNPWYAYIPLNVTRGKGPMWEKLTDQNRAWYQRSFVVPGGWAGRAVLLNLERVSTDAKVWVNGTECGSVAWPAGSVEITRAVRFGTTNALQLLVVAAEETGAVFEFMETAVSQVTAKEATLDSKGLIGDVTVSSRPPGAHVSDLFVQTSTRRQELTVNVELNGLARPGRVQLTARLLRAMDAAGNETEPLEEVRFAATCDVTAAATQTVQAAWSWPKPRLWDVGQPNLYTLLLEVRDDSTGFHDERAQRFGFREFWIEGRDFCLNGTRINLRPTVNEPGMGIAEVTDAGIDGLMACGFNFTELWPRDLYFRGTPHTRQMFLDRADRKGYLVAGNVASMNMSILDGKWKFAWNVPGVQEAWKQRVDSDLRLNRNHPSLIMWSTSPNFFGHAADQDPRFIGTRNYGRDDASWLQRAEAGREGVASIKASDPTRPVFTHQGAWVGDVHTVNMYLCLLPLQEREEWLSDYVKQGVMPLLPIEFGTPLHSTFMRGRRGFGDAGSSEPWMTEFCAIYMGPQAYAMEQPVYRKEIVARFVKDQEYLRWHANEPMEGAPAYQALQVLYIRNTWRSWRTWGLSGGMVPWIGDMRRWGPDTVGAATQVPIPWTPGRRGAYQSSISLDYMRDAPGEHLLDFAKTLVANNQPTLAWIAGGPEAFTDKSHHLRAGETVVKQIALINDTRAEQPWSFTWEALLNGKPLDSGKQSGRIGTAGRSLIPIRMTLPGKLAGTRVDGEIRLTAMIGSDTRTDTFPFRVYAPDTSAADPVPTIALFDPVGRTAELLKFLEIASVPLAPNGGLPDKTALLIIGREALSGAVPLPVALEAWVAKGGRALMMNQDPAWMSNQVGLRLAPYASRRVYPLPPFGTDFDAEDLRDWNGTSDVVEAYPDYRRWKGPCGPGKIPLYGWRWGNRHLVSSAPIEKPHLSGWRPLLECEFDLAYAAAMELDYGQGRLVWCALDLEDHALQDPAAERIARRLLQHALQAPLRPRAAQVTYLGGKAGFDALSALGMSFARADRLPTAPGLVVLDGETSVADMDLEAYLRAGGRVLVLAGSQTHAPLGARRQLVKAFDGSLKAPDWPEAAGLSSSDLRYRAACDSWLMAEGCDLGAEGLLGLRRVGAGVILYCQLDPARFNADERTYFRFTRWRQTRALTQVLANLGATFAADRLVFNPKDASLTRSLAGAWKARLTGTLQELSVGLVAPARDPGISALAARLVASDAPDADWAELPVPGEWQAAGGKWNVNGEVVYRLTLDLPESWAGQDLRLSLGTLDDFDTTFFNGVQVGGSPDRINSQYDVPRLYTIPGRIVHAGKNHLAVRIWDDKGAGGFTDSPDNLSLRVAAEPERAAAWYHPDYRDDFSRGDDPWRYYRW